MSDKRRDRRMGEREGVMRGEGVVVLGGVE